MLCRLWNLHLSESRLRGSWAPSKAKTKVGNATIWDTESPGIPLELQGDSLLIVSWLNGRWKCTNRMYRKRLQECIRSLDECCSNYLVRPPSLGSDIVRHEYREGNERADDLTHVAREGGPTSSNLPHTLLPYERDLYRLSHLRGAFDGGVSCEGSGCGCWLDAIYVLLPQFHAYPDLPRELTRKIVEEAFTISPESTVTDTELSALEALVRGTRQAFLRSWI